jgi:hypothetical protein
MYWVSLAENADCTDVTCAKFPAAPARVAALVLIVTFVTADVKMNARTQFPTVVKVVNVPVGGFDGFRTASDCTTLMATQRPPVIEVVR